MRTRNYITTLNHEAEGFDWKNYIPTNANKLILGTFPTKKALRRSLEFYYPNKQNRMWEILFSLAKLPFDKELTGKPAVAARKAVLDKLKLGMDDIGKRIYRLGNSSLDMNIFPVEYSNIFEILDQNPKINKIILTSSSKGHSVLSWFSHYCKMNNVTLEVPKEAKIPYSAILHFYGRQIQVPVLYSVSGAAGKSTDILKKMYADVILTS